MPEATGDIVALKKALRAEMRRLRLAVPPEECRRAGREIAARLDSLSGPLPPGAVCACYLSTHGEVDSAPLVAWCRARGFRIAVPAADGDAYRWAELSEGCEIASGPMGIAEPAGTPSIDAAELDLALVPGVAFDLAGHRLGHGRGHIDRLYGASPKCRKIGVAFGWQIVESVPCEPHDVSMDVVVSASAGMW